LAYGRNPAPGRRPKEQHNENNSTVPTMPKYENMVPEVVVTVNEGPTPKHEEERRDNAEFQEAYVEIVNPLCSNGEIELYQPPAFEDPSCNGENENMTDAEEMGGGSGSGQQTWKCGECNTVYVDAEEYKHHMLVAHQKVVVIQKDGINTKIKRQLCPHCNTWQTQLQRHVRRAHTFERPFACNICPRKYSEKYALDSHIRKIHMKPKRKSMK